MYLLRYIGFFPFALTNTVEDFGIVGLENMFGILEIMFVLSKSNFLFILLGNEKKAIYLDFWSESNEVNDNFTTETL